MSDITYITQKKQLGIYYTSAQLTELICKWAIRTEADTILEPSFGGCGFLEASVRRLTELGCTSPLSHIYGCDLDPSAFDHLSSAFGGIDLCSNFLQTDFLSVVPTDFKQATFSAVIGNPPYVSHHNMSPQQKLTAFALADLMGIKNKKASLWAYFVRHSLSFLAPGGRLAWVLPGSLVDSEYGAELLSALRNSFSRSVAILLNERLFLSEGAEERTVVLLCDNMNAGGGSNTQELGMADDLTDLSTTIVDWDDGIWHGFDPSIRPNRAFLNGARNIYEDLASRTNCRQLGDLCDIHIGLVTGANRFFILTQAEAEIGNLDPAVLTFILSRFTDAQGLNLSCSDQQEIQCQMKRCLLVDTSRVEEINGSLRTFLDEFPPDQRASNKTFQKRCGGRLWHRPNDGAIPDAFFPYMQTNGPALLLNGSKGTCTNAIHRVFFKAGLDATLIKLLCITMLSSFSQLSAEIEGRSYGSGVLKHEPSEAKKIKVILPEEKKRSDIDKAFEIIEITLRSGAPLAAQTAADEFILGCHADKERTEITLAIRNALDAARARRQRKPASS